MKHLPAFKAAVVAAAGITMGRLFPGYSIVFLSGAVAFAIVLAGWFLFGRERPGGYVAVGAYSSLLFAFAFYMSVNLASLNEARPGAFRVFAGTVDETPRDTSRYSIMLTDCYGFDKGWRAIQGALVLTPKSTLSLAIGDRIIFTGKAGVISAARNPGQFNLRTYYTLNGIAGRIYLKNDGDLLAVEHNRGFTFRRDIVEPVRVFIREKTSALMSGEEAALARAMVLGERAGINREINEQFINTGTIHILAVSGLHIGFLTGILMMLASLIRTPRRWRFFVIAPVLILYAYVVGLSPSVVRAVVMALVVLLGLFLQRKSRTLNSLGFAALAILAFSPAQLFSPGFQLSFAAVLSIAFFYERIIALVRKSHPALLERPFLNSVVSTMLLTFAATLGTIPLCAYYFNRVSVAGVFANLLIVPLSGIFMSMDFTFLLVSLLSVPVASVYAAAAQLIAFVILEINSLIGSLSISSIRVGDSAMMFGALYLVWLTAVIWFGKDSIPKKLIFAMLLGANMVLYAGLFTTRTEARMYVLDVGQGDAIYLELPEGKNMLIDAGSKFGSYDAGARVIVPFLRKLGVRELDYFVVTHLHSDHVGGAAGVLKDVKVREFIYPDQVSRSGTWTSTLAWVRALGIRARTVRAGTVLDSGLAYRVYVLHPNGRYTGDKGVSYRTRFNDGSIVLKVCIGGNSILLTGDIEQRVEHELTKTYGAFLSSGVLKAGHHGSITSSSQGLLDKVHPGYAIISVGKGNSFGHPSQTVIDRMSRMGVNVWRTDSLGAAFVRVRLDESQIVDWR
ncbi:MAG TPA: DNA internalization-related competence protein ComEC/Rec2 [Candidatus Kryptobacter bacterium]|nr:DNA internalization-related competence protein ComEC/Rec2 [Candidatus Kryptobacter bacterium]